jgi:hypothetical protein
MGALPQVLETIIEVQKKMGNEKITRRENNLSNLKNKFFFFFFFTAFLFSN